MKAATRSSLAILTALIALLCAKSGARADESTVDSTAVVSSLIEKRVVKTFDFDERRLGNYEDQPMNWLPMVGAGYPRFLEARFDMQSGHLAPPCFKFHARVGSAGAFYLAKDIPVHPDSAYRITAWVRTRQVRHARARISAYYLDHALRKIEGTEHWSEDLRDESGAEWTLARIDLPGGFDRARWIGLAFRIEQPLVTGGAEQLASELVHRDAHAEAWLDDISIMRLPIVSMQLNMAHGVYVGETPTGIDIAMRDLDGTGLRVDLRVLDAESRVIRERRLDASTLLGGPARVVLEPLPAGLYAAQVTTHAGQTLVSSHTRGFVRLNADCGGGGRQGFGIVADESIFEHGDLNVALMALLSPEMVKLPLWRVNQSDDEIVRGSAETDRLVDELLKLGIGVVGVFADLPPSLAADFEPPDRRLLKVLAGAPQVWRPWLALVLMRHGHRIHAWQVGSDGMTPPVDERLRDQALRNVRAEVQTLIGSPRLVAPVRTGIDGALPAADAVAVRVPAHIAARGLAGMLPSQAAGQARWATLETRNPTRYDRRWRLFDYAQRLIECRSAGIEAVFVPQPWRIEDAGGGPVVWHQEELIILRTLNQALGGLSADRDIWIADGVRAQLFADERGEHGALAVYADGQGTAPQRVAADLGQAAQLIDMWGNASPPEVRRGDLVFDLDAMPLVIQPVEPWRGRMLDSFRLDEPGFGVQVQSQVRQISFVNTRTSRLRGDLKLIPPPGWRIAPALMSVSLAPGATFSEMVAFHLPTNQPAGRTVLTARLRALDDDFEGITLRAPIEVNAPGLDVNAAAYVDGDHVRVIHRITNRTDDALRLKSYLVSADRSRDVRLIRNLAPGQTTVREYRIDDVASVIGRHIRLTVEQVDGPLRHNAVIKLD